MNISEKNKLLSILSSLEKTRKFVDKCSDTIYNPNTSTKELYKTLANLVIIGNNMPIGCSWNDLWVEVYTLIKKA